MVATGRIAVLVVLFCLVAPGLAAKKTLDEPLIIPSAMCHGIWLVDVEFGDEQDSLRFVYDTGAGSHIVDPDSIERVFGKRVKAGKKVKLRNGRIGPVEIRKMSAEAVELDHLGRALSQPIDGILGYPAFKQFLLTLDYRAQEIRLSSGALPAVDGENVLSDIGQRRPFLAIDLGPKTVPMLVDSGFTGGIKLRQEDPVEWIVEPRAVGANVRLKEIVTQNAGRARGTLELGALDIVDPIVQVQNRTRLLGYKVLQRFEWTFDQRNRRVRLIPYDKTPLTGMRERGMGVAFRPTARGQRIERVLESSPAERAGLREGDLVLSINGQPINERGCDGPTESNEQADSLELGIERDGEPLQVSVEIADLIP